MAASGWLLYSCGDGFAWGWGLSCNSCPVPPLFFFFVPAQLPLPLLPLRGSAPLPSGLACLSPACWSTPRIGWRGLAATFSSVPVRCFSYCRHIGIFWASPAPLACWGSWGFAHCVRVFQLRCCLLGLQVGFPCCLFLTLEWVYFWLRCLQSLWATKAVHHLFLELGWFLVMRWWLLLRLLVLVSSDARLHLPGALASSSTPISGSWMVQAPAFSWALPWVLPSRFPCWLLARDD